MKITFFFHFFFFSIDRNSNFSLTVYGSPEDLRPAPSDGYVAVCGLHGHLFRNFDDSFLWRPGVPDLLLAKIYRRLSRRVEK